MASSIFWAPSRHNGLILVIGMLYLLSVYGFDICMLGDAEMDLGGQGDVPLSEFVHTHSVPVAGKRAGHFARVPSVDNWIDCVVRCCLKDYCDVAFFFSDTCYLVHCNVTIPGGCQPVKRSRVNSTLVIVRQPEYRAASETLVPHSPAMAAPAVPAPQQGPPCEFGLQQCGQGEECAPQDPARSRERFGSCVCLPDHQRDSQGVCTRSRTRSRPEGAPESGPEADQEDQSAISAELPGMPTVPKLTVSAGENRVLRLPDNSITLSVFVLPKPTPGEKYHYEWSPMGQPEGSEERATMHGKNTDTLKLSRLIAGLYRMKVQVTGENAFGEAYVNVTVLPRLVLTVTAQRQNKPPVAVITPASQHVKSENSFILDGSDSTDDDGITAYHWEEVSGPLQEHQIDDDTQTLKLKDMAPGLYVFRLTVTDTDGVTNSTSATVTVIKETDYPPKANAGSDVIIHLPQKSVVLCGNSSTDDKAIVSYEWIKKSDSLTADMTGVRTVCLRLNNLELGDYTLTLRVMDTGGNEASADVHVYVKPGTDHPPVARTAKDITVKLPIQSIVLDGNSSTDDKEVVAYTWTQTGGPTSLSLTQSDHAVAMATGDIQAGYYQFKLTVSDAEEQTSSDKLNVHVQIDANLPPVARAGGDRVVLLPASVVSLDGSGSWDDQGIVSYLWERHVDSLAAGDTVNGSEHQAVLQLVNVVSGRYVFSLTVVDDHGLSSQDTASLLVKDGEDYKDLLELVLDTDIHQFRQDDEINVVKQLELLIRESPMYSHSRVHMDSTQQELTRGQLRLTFFVRQRNGSAINGVEMVRLMREKLSDYTILGFPIASLDTVVCQNNCSGHGQCDSRSRTCRCDIFWMPNVITLVYSRRSNCEWSIVYVVIITFAVLGATFTSIGLIVCCCRSPRCRLKSKKRHRYALLEDDDDADDDEYDCQSAMLPKAKIKHNGVMVSESDFSSDEEKVLFQNKPANGHHRKLTNGVTSPQRTVKQKT